jgi:formate hydrogenlyase subunit 6/NADH:ubiquinone oxidoreductase subunit I
MLKYFKAEYIDKLQGALSIANELAMYRIVEVKCTGCDKCSELCPMKAIRGKKFELHQIDEARCIKCGRCFKICPVGAINLVKMEKTV